MKRAAPYLGWSGLAFGFLALLWYVAIPQFPTWMYTLLLFSIINLATFFVVDRENIQHALRSRRAMYGINAAVLIFVFLGILIFINILANRHKTRWDLTETGYFTLAPQTQNVLAKIPRPIKLTAFFQNESPEKKSFEQLANGYLELTDQIEINYVDPDKSPAITKQYGITTYGTIVLESGDRETKIQKSTEENLTNAILNVTQDIQKKVYFLEGHGEKRIDDTEKSGYSEIRKALEKNNFVVSKLLLIQSALVPDDADLLVIAGPQKELVDAEKNAVEDYLSRGGSIFFLIDPQTDGGLSALIERWGAAVQDDIVVDPMSRMLGGDSAAPVVSQYAQHGITKDFTLPTIFPYLRSVNAVTTEGLESAEVLFTGQNSWAESEYQSGKAHYNADVDRKGPVPVAVAVTQKPKAPPAGEEPEPQPMAHLVAVGDSDFVTNNYLKFAGNSDFFLNTAAWLMEEEDLIAIRPRQRKASPMPLTSTQGTLVFVIGSILLPLTTALVGFRVWWRRRSL